MLLTIAELSGYQIQAGDGPIGKVDDLLLEDDTHAIRWLEINTGWWLTGRRVLLPPQSCRPDPDAQALHSELSKQQIRSSPDAASDRPVSRQYELLLFEHYGLAPYWGMPGGGLAVPPTATPIQRELHELEDQHLRSARELQGYSIHAADECIGHIEDFMVEAENWRLAYVIVDTRNWLPGGRKVVLKPDWFDGFDHIAREARSFLRAESIRTAPEYQPEISIDLAYEDALLRHYHQFVDDRR